jgi:hypothetical protein
MRRALAAAIVRSVMQGVLDGALQGGGEESCVVSLTGATGVRVHPPPCAGAPLSGHHHARLNGSVLWGARCKSKVLKEDIN